MMGGKAKLASALGLILVFASVMLYMRIFPAQENIHWTGLLFIVLGEGLPAAAYIRLEELRQRIGAGLRTGLYSLLFVYGLGAVALALFFVLSAGKAGLLAVLELVWLLGCGGVFLFAAVTGAERGKPKEDAALAVAFMRGLESEIGALGLTPAGRLYGAQLSRIGEALRYSDYSGRTGADGALAEKVREIGVLLRGAGADSGAAATAGAGTAAGAGAGTGGGTGGGTGAFAGTGAAEAGTADTAEARAAREEAKRARLADALTEDILGLIRTRDRMLLDEKKARSMRNG